MFVRNKWLMLFVLTTILLISACGNSENEVEDSNEVGDDQTVYPDEETSSSEREAEMDEANNAEQTDLSEAVEDEEVWYQVTVGSDEPIGKDTGINAVYVFKNNEVSKLTRAYDNSEPFTLGTIDDMSDDEIVEYLLDEYPKIEAERNEEGRREQFMSDAYLNEPYTWRLRSDETGNATDRMRFQLDKDSDKVKEEINNHVSDVDMSTSPLIKEPLGYAVNVFDRYYDGFYRENEKNNRVTILTRIDSEEDVNGIKLDDPDRDREDIIIE